MATSYPEVTDAELRAQYQKPDQAQAQKILRFMVYASIPLLYVDFILLGLGTPFFALSLLRAVVIGYACWILSKCAYPAQFAHLERQLFFWSIVVLSVQLVSDFLAPLTYFGHFLIDAWVCVLISIVLPIRSAYIKRLVFSYLFVVIVLCLTKIFPSTTYQAIIFAVLLLSAYTGQAVGASLHKFRLKLLSAEFELQRKEITDPLTGIANRREFLRIVESEMLRHLRLAKPMSVLIFDIEGLKQINLQYGAGTADLVLVEVSKRMQRATRNYDCLARYGTEEFVVLLPEAEAEIASKVASRALNTIGAIPVPVSGKEVRVSAKVGIATMQEADSLESMLKRAEDDLQRLSSPTVSSLQHSMAYA
ncbi:GGDEF domain-containing protein [Undibacterium flavidum]|uniref:diguanylate cyclase n=1 Tax=Undibacterium flavidum TaxID=2762297 RepID=A0ABR6YEQ6_9BURK|nr:GGDEF domain-containing protein [Undibacterium flavidum]MBC3875035.1 GGDEF domain-containing protein [Undibacterium flavidum]